MILFWILPVVTGGGGGGGEGGDPRVKGGTAKGGKLERRDIITGEEMRQFRAL